MSIIENALIKQQKAICSKYNADFHASADHLKLGISLDVKKGVFPIHGLRHPLEQGTSGWFIWAGEYSDDSDFFLPVHIKHSKDWSPLIQKYLGLAPGWRFLITKEYEDVWHDVSLLDI